MKHKVKKHTWAPKMKLSSLVPSIHGTLPSIDNAESTQKL